jgi:hypothetical protein
VYLTEFNELIDKVVSKLSLNELLPILFQDIDNVLERGGKHAINFK